MADLTPTMRRHLAELAEVAKRGEAYWYPHAGEWRTAEALASRGLVKRQFGYGMGGRCFALTEAGLDASRDSRPASKEDQ